jgi:hypothetical protein
LASEFRHLNRKLTAWDAAHFGEPGDASLGQPERVSVKKF